MKPKGGINLHLGSKGFFTVVFTSLEDKDRVFEGGPYFYAAAGDEPQILVTIWAHLAYLPCSTLHIFITYASFLSIFVLFVGRRAVIMPMWLIHDDFRFFSIKWSKYHANGDKETTKVALRVYREVVHSLE